MTTVTWVLNSGSYEVSSKEHLLQIMNTGSLYTNAGSPPSNYLTTSYIQTADIDLLNDITNIIPIATFTGTYDGGNFSVSNWSCTTSGRKALFGVTSGCTVKNMVLDGIWTCSAIVDGSLFAGHNSSSQFYNITTNFSSGTIVEGSSSSLGMMFAYTGPGCIIEGLTLGGTITTFTGSGYTGCITGFSSGATYNHVRNIATFENAVTTTHSHLGGMFGASTNDTMSHLMNAMTGDITGNLYAGGIYGTLSGGTTNYINQSMTGNITATGNAAGIASTCTDGGTESTHLLNYMKGDVANGFFGTNARAVNTSILAMEGTTTNAFSVTNTGTVEVLLDDNYGLVYTDSTDTVTTMDVSSFLSDMLLPYFAFSYLDGGGTQHDWTVVFVVSLLEGIRNIVEGILSVTLNVFPVAGATNYTLSYQSSSETETFVADINSAVSLEEEINIVTTTHSIVYTLTLYVDGVSFQTETFTPLTDVIPLIPDSLVAWYLFNDPATFLEDNSGNGNTLTDVDGVESVDDSEYGTVAYFSNSPTKYFSLASAPVSTLGASPRTISYWVKQIGTESYRIMFGFGTTSELRVQFSNTNFDIEGGSGYNSGVPSASGSWLYITLTYDGTTERTYFDGVLSKTSVRTYNTSAGALFIGSAPNFASGFSINGYMTDFRIYDEALSDTEISTLYSTGPTAAVSLLTLDAKSVYITVTSPQDLVNPYRRIDVTDPESNTTTVVTGSTDLEYIIPDLIPETEYTIDFYNSTDDSTYTLAETGVITTLTNTAANFDSSEFLDDTTYDLSTLSSSTLSIIGEILDELFVTADLLKITDSTGTTYETSFVNLGSTVDISDSSAFYLPFSGSTAGQQVTVTLTDTTPSVITYNETSGSISVGGTTYVSGQSFKLDGKTIFISS